MLKVYYWLHRKFKDIPCKKEIAECVSYLNTKHWGPQKTQVVGLYLWGSTIEDIASSLELTRARVRGLLWSVYHRSQIPRWEVYGYKSNTDLFEFSFKDKDEALYFARARRQQGYDIKIRDCFGFTIEELK